MLILGGGVDQEPTQIGSTANSDRVCSQLGGDLHSVDPGGWGLINSQLR